MLRIGMMASVPEAAVADACCAALGVLIDHAALFPPASMSLEDALSEDARVRAAPEAWLVRRFVVPAARLGSSTASSCRLLVLDADYTGGDARVEAVEARPGTEPESVAGLAEEVYVELPADLERLAALGLRAKVRCGGASVPPAAELAQLIRRRRELDSSSRPRQVCTTPSRGTGSTASSTFAACAFPGDEEPILADVSLERSLSEGALRWRERESGRGGGRTRPPLAVRRLRQLLGRRAGRRAAGSRHLVSGFCVFSRRGEAARSAGAPARACSTWPSSATSSGSRR